MESFYPVLRWLFVSEIQWKEDKIRWNGRFSIFLKKKRNRTSRLLKKKKLWFIRRAENDTKASCLLLLLLLIMLLGWGRERRKGGLGWKICGIWSWITTIFVLNTSFWDWIRMIWNSCERKNFVNFFSLFSSSSSFDWKILP